MTDFEIRGADEFLKLSKALKSAGRTGMRKELNKRIRAAAKPAIKNVKDAARAGLPQAGGAGAFIAGKKFRVATKTGRDPGVSVVMAKQDPRLDTEGRLAHPVFGRQTADGRRVYAVTRVRPGVMSSGFQDAAPEIRKDVEAAIESVVDDIVRGV